MSPMSPGSRSAIIESDNSPLRIPPPYRAPPPPEGSPIMVGVPESQSNIQYRDCVDEFKNAISILRNSEIHQNENEQPVESSIISTDQEFSLEKSSSKDYLVKSLSSSYVAQSLTSIATTEDNDGVKTDVENCENKLSVKEAMRKFNRIASEEEAKITSPPGKMKKPEKVRNYYSFKKIK